MESLLKQLRELPARFAALPAGLRVALIAGVAIAVAIAVGVGIVARGGEYQYAFTNLTQEDSTEAAGVLKTSQIPFRLEANGSALAVPSDKVYDARILLATAGLPRGGGIGFELFDRGDLGVSEFTQRVNLRRAIEGELARTIGTLSEVRSARVTLSLGEKGLYRDEDKKPSASVVVVTQPGRSLGERELAGVRHLVSSAVPGLAPEGVTVLDGRGAVLSADSAWDSPEASYQRKLEREYEQRIVTLLEPVVGAGSVIAKVTASVDHSQVNQNSEVFDPEQVALRSERKVSGSSSNQTNGPQGVTGAQANVPLQPQPQPQGPVEQGNTSNQDELKNFEITKTTTQTVARLPRLQKLSLAVIVDGVDGKPRSLEDITRLGELARKAVGYDEVRGDQFEITSQVFGRSPEPEAKPLPLLPPWILGAIGAGLLAAIGVAFALRSRNKKVAPQSDLVLQPGATVSAIEAKAREAANAPNAANASSTLAPGTNPTIPQLPKVELPLLPDPLLEIRERAKLLLRNDQTHALGLIQAWLKSDAESPGESDHG
jgi:flagellar M-ring protein FliF